ncbi:MAG TPA: T9SS type A sorting domain-containing protein [Candidatus Kapabacteria bacterium]
MKRLLFSILLPAALWGRPEISYSQTIPGLWHKAVLAQPNGAGNDHIMDFGFCDSSNGLWLSTEGLISSSSNGGKSWSVDSNLFPSFSGEKFNLNCLECTAPHRGFFHSDQYAISISPFEISQQYPPNMNEVNGGAYTTLSEKMYDTSHGVRLVYCKFGNEYARTLAMIATNDGWQSSALRGTIYIDSNATDARIPFYSGYLVDSNEAWTARLTADTHSITMMHTTNAGMQWDSLFTFSGTLESVVQQFFVNKQIGTVLFECNLNPIDYVYSGDYGKTWRMDSTFDKTLWRMANPAPGIFWGMIGQQGDANVDIFPLEDAFGQSNIFSRKLAYSSDTGHTWIIDSNTFIDDSLEEMHFLDARHGWIASWSHDSEYVWYYDADHSNASVEHNWVRYTSGSISIYPNPTQTWITASGAQQPVSITDALGRKCPCAETGNTLDVSHLSPGVYFVSNASQHTVFVKE